MGDKEDPKGSGVPPKDHLRVENEEFVRKEAPGEKTVIIEKTVPEPSSEGSGNGDD